MMLYVRVNLLRRSTCSSQQQIPRAASARRIAVLLDQLDIMSETLLLTSPPPLPSCSRHMRLAATRALLHGAAITEIGRGTFHSLHYQLWDVELFRYVKLRNAHILCSGPSLWRFRVIASAFHFWHHFLLFIRTRYDGCMCISARALNLRTHTYNHL